MQNLFQFNNYISKSIAEFNLKYQDAHSINPDQYPLVLPDGNEGLWLEFFTMYLETGEV